MAELIDPLILKKLIPANSLNGENFQELASQTYVAVVPKGEYIFKKNDDSVHAVYLLEGNAQIEKKSGPQLVKGGTSESSHPLENKRPRQHSVRAITDCKIARVDPDLIDVLMTWDQLSGLEVGELSVSEDGDDTQSEDAEGGDWMTRILQSKAFMKIPPANIQALFMRVEEIPVKKGDSILKQGEEGDYYYIVKIGKCKVTRATKKGSELVLATLTNGDAFGEEALLSDSKRNANVVMAGDGKLMRLSKQDFNELLKEPMLSWLEQDDAKKMVKEDGAVWLDVRLDSEYKNSNIEGSINIPLFMLRLKIENLDTEKKYILYCDSGKRSSAGAFLLGERGIAAYCLQGGLVAYNP
ncbi:MAG: cyclic nucleotide-binding domain-containing protein [Candidatus Eutrophobiaceae bacterium]